MRTAGGAIFVGVLLALTTPAAVGAEVTPATGADMGPIIRHPAAVVSSNRLKLSAEIDPEQLETSYELALIYHLPGCCPPGAKECCKEGPDYKREMVGAGRLAASSSSHEVQASAMVPPSQDSVRFLVIASNAAGSHHRTVKA